MLALQGNFREHLALLRSLGVDTLAVRRPEDIGQVDGLVIPGGESTVMDKLARSFGLADPLRAAIAEGLPVFGTCAGLIMLADRVLDRATGQQSLGGLDVTVRRNAFGTQTESFEVELDIPAFGAPPVHAAFIRAPVVEEAAASVTVLASLDDGRIVAVEQGNLLGCSFHPEMSGEPRFHEHFLRMVAAAA